MAARKKLVLTPEERLEAALVPQDEWPYEVPENWCWIRISSGFEVASSKRVHKQDWLTTGIPFYRTRELVKLSENGYVDNELFISEELYTQFVTAYGCPQIGDLLISGVGTIGVPYIVASDEPFYFKDGNIIWFKNRGLFLPEYVYHVYRSMFMQNQIHAMSAGTTVDTYTIINANRTLIPLPPLNEQRRIVSRIEWLFSKLDDAEAKLRGVIDSSKQRQAAILHEALNGELTANWRSEHSISIEHWQEKTLADVTTRIFDGPFGSHLKTKDYIGSGVRVVRLENLRHLFFDDSKQSYVSEEKYEEIKAHTVVPTDIIMSTFISGDMKVCQLPEYIDFAANKADCIGIRPRHDISTRFLLYVLASNRTFDYLSGLIHGSTRPRVNTRQIRSIPIQLPCMAEQQQIASILDRAFGNYQRAITSATDALETIGELKAAILAKALRGELGTHDPDEPSSKELLANIINSDASKR